MGAWGRGEKQIQAQHIYHANPFDPFFESVAFQQNYEFAMRKILFEGRAEHHKDDEKLLRLM